MLMLTSNFFMDNLALIGVERIPHGLLEATKEYLERRQNFYKVEMSNNHSIMCDTRRIFILMQYYGRLKSDGIDDTERGIGLEGCKLVNAHVSDVCWQTPEKKGEGNDTNKTDRSAGKENS